VETIQVTGQTGGGRLVGGGAKIRIKDDPFIEKKLAKSAKKSRMKAQRKMTGLVWGEHRRDRHKLSIRGVARTKLKTKRTTLMP